MKPTFSFYTAADFERVYQFLSERDKLLLPYDRVRFQFAYALHPDFTGIAGGFEQTCGIWRDEGGIVALVMTEGGTQWKETFYVFRSMQDQTPELMERMCRFAERFTSEFDEDRKHSRYRLAVPEEDELMKTFVAARGYQMTEQYERRMIKEYPRESEPVILPEGFTIRDARSFPPLCSALAHRTSFCYNFDGNGKEHGFAKIRTMPDYKPELDLVVFDPEGQPAGLVNFWVESHSDIAQLEPLGVVWWCRRLGLAQALVTEGINRSRKYGCTQVIGGDQPFYWEMNFRSKKTFCFWEWSSEE